jgi:hypothetical protein
MDLPLIYQTLTKTLGCPFTNGTRDGKKTTGLGPLQIALS